MLRREEFTREELREITEKYARHLPENDDVDREFKVESFEVEGRRFVYATHFVDWSSSDVGVYVEGISYDLPDCLAEERGITYPWLSRVRQVDDDTFIFEYVGVSTVVFSVLIVALLFWWMV